MGNNSFGRYFRFTTFGESHGKAIGVVIDGVPAGLTLSCDEINEALKRRAPGNSPFTSPRKESDLAEAISGLFEGKTTGAPLTFLIQNHDVKDAPYTAIQGLHRPGHATLTYLEKYGHFDPRGGGRASARETACRVIAGEVARKILAEENILALAYIDEIGGISATLPELSFAEMQEKTRSSSLFCPDVKAEEKMMKHLEKMKEEGDSVGGVVGFLTNQLPFGLGDPVYEKLEARLAFAMMGIPASKGFEIGEGFSASRMRGSDHNDPLYKDEGKIASRTNHAGGTLGGISNGMPLFGKVAFKPTSSIKQPIETVTYSGKSASLKHKDDARHDPCVAIRAVPVVEAMLLSVLADCTLANRLSRI